MKIEAPSRSMDPRDFRIVRSRRIWSASFHALDLVHRRGRRSVQELDQRLRNRHLSALCTGGRGESKVTLKIRWQWSGELNTRLGKDLADQREDQLGFALRDRCRRLPGTDQMRL